MPSLVKSVPCKQEELHLITRTHILKNQVWCVPVIVAVEGGETGSQGLHASQPSLLSKLPPKGGREGRGEEGALCPLMHMHTYSARS